MRLVRVIHETSLAAKLSPTYLPGAQFRDRTVLISLRPSAFQRSRMPPRTPFPRIPLASRVPPVSTSVSQHRPLSTTLHNIRKLLLGCPRKELFGPTNGRWLWDEERYVAEHTRTFNVPALKAAAGEVLGVAGWRVRLNKFADGGSNKIILARGGGRRVIIKLPDPIVPARVVTASEVAAMEFVRSELDIPAPKVLKWSWDAAGPVGAEYVIMEEAEESMAWARWPDMELEGKARVLKELIAVDKKFLRSNEFFKDVGYGSLYFTEDAEALGFKEVFEVKVGRNPGRFCLGPLTKKHLWPDDNNTSLDRGPWRTPQAYLTSLADASTHHLMLRGEPTPKTKPFLINCNATSDHGFSTSWTNALLTRFRGLCPGLVHPTLSAPTLWHRDLSQINIFVSPTGSISRIIDWQDTYVLPLFLQACIPELFNYDQSSQQSDPEVTSDPLSPLGEVFPSEDDKDTQERLEFAAMTQLYVNYLCAASGELGEELRGLLEKQRIPMSRCLGASMATSTFETTDDTLLLWSIVIRIMREWEKIAPGTQCPATFKEGEIKLWEESAGWRNSWLDLLDMFKMPRGNRAWVDMKEFESENENMKDFVRSLLKEGFSGDEDETAKKRERFIRHLKSWNLTDWNGGKSWIDGVREEPNAEGKSDSESSPT